MHDEMKLLHRVRSLDQEALAEVHNRYYDSIYRYIAFRVNDAQTAEDLTSDVFFAISERRARQICPAKHIARLVVRCGFPRVKRALSQKEAGQLHLAA